MLRVRGRKFNNNNNNNNNIIFIQVTLLQQQCAVINQGPVEKEREIAECIRKRSMYWLKQGKWRVNEGGKEREKNNGG